MKKIDITLIFALLLASPVLGHREHASHGPSSKEENPHESHHQHSPSASTLQMSIKVSHPLEKGKEVLTTIVLTSKKDSQPISPTDLKEVHTKKVHLLIFDQTLNDYQHIHPTPSSKAGEYTFTWTPQRDGFYRIWADLIPVSSNQQEYIVGDIPSKVKDIYPVEKSEKLTAADEGLGYTLSFDKPSLKVGESVLGEVNILDKEGKAFQGLEPVMGTFAHIVAVSEDFQTVEHVHPLGAEDLKLTERGGPKLQFHLTPSKTGYLKIYVQVQIQGKQRFIPFGIQVIP